MIYKIKQYILENKIRFNLESDDISFIQINSNPNKILDYSKIIVLWFIQGTKNPFLITKIAKNEDSGRVIRFEDDVKKIYSSKFPNIPVTVDKYTFSNHLVYFEKPASGISWQKIIEKCKSDNIEKITNKLFFDWLDLFNTFQDIHISTASPFQIDSTKEMTFFESKYLILRDKNSQNCDLIAQNIFYNNDSNWIIDWELVTTTNKIIPTLRFFHNFFQQLLSLENTIPSDSPSKFRELIFKKDFWFHKLCKNTISKIILHEISDEEWIDYWKYFYMWELELQKKISISKSANHILDLKNRLSVLNEDIFAKDQKIIQLEAKLKNLVDKENENSLLKSRLQELESSTSWKLTQPLRSGMDFIKKSTINTRIQTKRQLDKLAPYIPQPIKNTIKPVYHRLFSGIPNNSVLQLTLDKVDPDLIDDTLHRETMLDIFVFPVIDWHGRYQRPQQIISRLAKRGHRVFYFSPTFNRTDSTDLEKSIKIGNICENIYQIQLPSTQDINIYQDTLAPDQVNILQKSISIIKDKFKIGHSVSIVHQPFWFSLVKTISRNKIVYDCMDDHSGFSTNTTKQSDLENDLLSSSDCVITTSVSLHQKAHEYNQNTALIRNGSDIKHFANLPSCQESLIKKPIIGYYGAISDWFDCELVARCAKHYPNYSFVLIGNTYGADLRPIENLPNVHLLGEKKYEELPNLLSCFDVCLIPFKINNLTLATNPVKFYEYISSGKAVVTVELPELKDHQDICYFSKSQQEFIDNIQKALDENDNEIISKRKAVALANSWKSRVDDFEKKIYQLYPSVSIVIVTFGNLEYTKNCLESIFKYSRYPNYELIIIDNNSSDSTPAYLQEISDIFPNIKIILNQDNKGFAKANNQGIKIAEGEYIILLNNDTIVTNDWIWGMVYHMETNPDIGLLGPVTNSIGNEQKIDVDYRDIEGMQQFAWKYTRKNQDIINENKMLALFCTIARKSDLEKVGLLSEEYEVGMFEDDDLSHKFKQIDKKIVMTDDVFVHHIGRASFAKLDDQKYMQIFNKNKAIFEDKWGPWIPHQPRKKKG